MQGLAAATGSASFPFRASWNPNWRKESKLCAHFSNFNSPTPLRLSANSTSRRNVNDIGPFTANQFFGRGLPTLRPNLGKHSKYLESVRVYKDDFFKIKIPKILEKPEWWWRTLACIPYLISLQISDVGYYLQPFLEKHDAIGDMIYFIPGAITRWPTWFFMAYCYIGYLWVVKNKKLPHYFRFHVMMGMLLETALQIVWCSSNFFPLIHFKGRLGMYYWMAIGFTYICLLLECIRCALAGVYAHIPFISNAAFIHTLFHMS